MRNHKRAVSPVIAIVLLIALTVAAASVIWVLTSDLLDSDNTTAVLESVDFQDNDGNGMVDKISFLVRSLGSDSMNIEGIAITVNSVPFTNWVMTSQNNEIPSGGQINTAISTVDPAQQLTNENIVVVTFSLSGNRLLVETLEIPSQFGFGQIGEANSIVVGGTPVQVNFTVPYIDPVVVVIGMTSDISVQRGGTDAAQSAMVTEVTSTSFKLVQISDPNDTDGITTTEVNYIVMESGIHQIRTMTIMVGKFDATGSRTYYDFPANFSSTPAIIMSTQTNDMGGTPRSRGGFSNSNNFTIQVEDGFTSNPGSSFKETVAYIAIEQGFDIISGLQAYRTGDTVDEKWSAIAYNVGYFEKPIVVAHLTREDGGNPAYTVITEIGTTSFKASIEETNGYDGNHTFEIIDYVAIKMGKIVDSSL